MLGLNSVRKSCKGARTSTLAASFVSMKNNRNRVWFYCTFLYFFVVISAYQFAFAANEVSKTSASNYIDDQSPMSLKEKISAGRRKFSEPWSLRNDLEGVWGLGPTFNEASCPACHQNAARSAAPAHGQAVERGMVIRLSVPGRADNGGALQHPRYGEQLQNRSIANRVPREGRATAFYEPVEASFSDGERIVLRKPRIEFSDLQFGELGQETLISSRNAPPLFGLGLLEAVPESALLELAQQQKSKGVSGRPNYVWDEVAGKVVIGRFGWKANQPNLRQQIAAALINDIGATSDIFPVDNCPDDQHACRTDPMTTNCGGGCAGQLLAEVLPSRLETLTVYLQTLQIPNAAPSANVDSTRGEELFVEAGCGTCHVAELKTGDVTDIPDNANVVFKPYTDLLLHDMGDALADGRPDFLADGHEWRTAPLWGIGAENHSDLLHDGRARDVTEAVLWHGGEAQSAREKFRQMSASERAALIKFVRGL